jgi:hypothetical protein
MAEKNLIAKALVETLISPNVADSNLGFQERTPENVR